jgi:hypothetical protein
MAVTQRPLAPEQVAQIAYEAGFRGDALWRAVAISGRESGYKPWARNDSALRFPAGDPRNTGDNSYGLMQLNTAGTNDANIRRILGQLGYNPGNLDQLLDPVVNMRVAYVLSGSGTNWRPWGPYKGVSELTNTDPAAAQQAVARAQSQGLLGKQWTGSASGAVLMSALPGGIPNPIDVAGGVASGAAGAASGVWDFITNPAGAIGGWVGDFFNLLKPFALYAVVLAGGAGLILLGAKRSVDPIVNRRMEQVQQVAPIAAAAAV